MGILLNKMCVVSENMSVCIVRTFLLLSSVYVSCGWFYFRPDGFILIFICWRHSFVSVLQVVCDSRRVTQWPTFEGWPTFWCAHPCHLMKTIHKSCRVCVLSLFPVVHLLVGQTAHPTTELQKMLWVWCPVSWVCLWILDSCVWLTNETPFTQDAQPHFQGAPRPVWTGPSVTTDSDVFVSDQGDQNGVISIHTCRIKLLYDMTPPEIFGLSFRGAHCHLVFGNRQVKFFFPQLSLASDNSSAEKHSPGTLCGGIFLRVCSFHLKWFCKWHKNYMFARIFKRNQTFHQWNVNFPSL